MERAQNEDADPCQPEEDGHVIKPRRIVGLRRRVHRDRPRRAVIHAGRSHPSPKHSVFPRAASRLSVGPSKFGGCPPGKSRIMEGWLESWLGVLGVIRGS